MNSRPVEVFTISLLEAGPVVLSDEERARAARFRFEEDRTRWTRAHSALRRILFDATGASHPGGPETLRFEFGVHGKPRLADHANVEFNLSHAGDWALVAVSSEVPVGIDIERGRTGIEMAALLRRLGETEIPESAKEQLQRWTWREARSKAAGGALFDPPADHIRAVALEAPAGYAASLALAGYEPRPVYRLFNPSSE